MHILGIILAVLALIAIVYFIESKRGSTSVPPPSVGGGSSDTKSVSIKQN